MLKNILFLFFISYNLFANQKANTDTLKFVFEPDSIFLHIGETGANLEDHLRPLQELAIQQALRK